MDQGTSWAVTMSLSDSTSRPEKSSGFNQVVGLHLPLYTEAPAMV